MAPAIGIDLGTTYSVVAWVTPDGAPEVILDEDGQALIPSVVSFAAGRPVVGRGQPLAAAQQAARAFVGQVDLTTTAVGLIAFSDSVRVELKASQKATDIGKAIDGLRIGRTGVGNAGRPFDELCRLLHQREGRRVGLVLADGVWSCQPLAIQQARRCHKVGVDIIAVGFGGADRAFLDRIASATENSFFTGMNGLAATSGTIARELTESGGPHRGIRAQRRQ
jgi:hypothetical protein